MVAAMAVAGATGAWAEDEFNRRGAFVGAGGSYEVEAFQNGTRTGDFGNSLGFNVRGGYRVNDYFAAEGIYEYADDFGSDRTFSNEKLQTNLFTGNGKLIVPLGRFQPFLEAGLGFLDANRSGRTEGEKLADHGFNLAGRVGGGMDLWATRNVSLFLDASYVIPMKEIADLQYFSFGWGARYNF
jgi:hypothetical protein